MNTDMKYRNGRMAEVGDLVVGTLAATGPTPKEGPAPVEFTPFSGVVEKIDDLMVKVAVRPGLRLPVPAQCCLHVADLWAITEPVHVVEPPVQTTGLDDPNVGQESP